MSKTITIEVQELDKKVMFLHKHLGDGTLGKTEFDADIRLPDHSIIVKVEGKRYLVDSQEIIGAVIQRHEKESKPKICDRCGAESKKDLIDGYCKKCDNEK